LYPPPILSGVRDRNQFRGSTFHRWLAVDACALFVVDSSGGWARK
jgi:hypothetical protein